MSDDVRELEVAAFVMAVKRILAAGLAEDDIYAIVDDVLDGGPGSVA